MLKAAQGRVRCGRCSNVFNALTFLIEKEPAAAPAPEDRQADPAPLPGAHQEQPVFDATADDLPFDPEQFNSDHIPESALEFDLAADQLTNVFVEAPAPSITVTHGPRLPVSDADDDTAEHEVIDIEVIEPAIDRPATRGEFILPSGTRVRLDGGGEENSAVDESGIFRAIAPDRRTRRRSSIGWTVASALLGLLLTAQIVHFNRQALVRNPVAGPALARLYAALGSELSPAWDLQAYQLRQWGAAAEPGTNGTLRVRASLFNGANHAQPYPLLRLILQDRFGGRVGLRDLEPREYLRAAPAERQLLGAGQRIDAEIAIVDPGQDAVGFEIDVCLQGTGTHITCASDQPRQAG